MNFVTNKFNFITINYKDIAKEAQALCDKEKFSKAVINNSILGPQNRVDSKIGEIIISKFLGLPLDNYFTYDLSFGLDGTSKIEIKTKRRDVNAKPEFIGDIAKTSQHQFANCEKKIIAFVSLNKLSFMAEICGFISVSRFLRTMQKEGQNDISFIPIGTKLDKGYEQRSDGWQIKYSCLMSPLQFKNFMKENGHI